MSCKCVLKILMVLFNCTIFGAGVVIMAIGALVEINSKHVLGLLDNIKDFPPELRHLVNAGYLLIAVGATLSFMGFLGCYGACCEDKCTLMTFFTVILIVFIVEVVAAVLFLLYQPTVEKLLDKMRENVAKNIKENYGQNDILTNAWNETMSLMNCCGYNNYTDFTGSSFVTRTSQYPKFCCPIKLEQCDITEAASKSVDGCFKTMVLLVKRNFGLLGVMAIFVIAIEVAVMIMSLILYKK